MEIILDCDDVLYDTNRYALDKLNKKVGSIYNINDIKKWGILHNDLDQRLEFFNDPSFMYSVPLKDNAVDFVNMLLRKHDVFICTSVQPQCAEARIEAIKRDFPDLEISNISIKNTKNVSGDFMLDDGPHNLCMCDVRVPILYSQPWNVSNNKFLRVNNYGEFLQLLENKCVV